MLLELDFLWRRMLSELGFLAQPDELLGFVAESVGRMVVIYVYIKIIELALTRLTKNFKFMISISAVIAWVLMCAVRAFPVMPDKHLPVGLVEVQDIADIISALVIITVRKIWNNHRTAKTAKKVVAVA
jgi:hypothetical protein